MVRGAGLRPQERLHLRVTAHLGAGAEFGSAESLPRRLTYERFAYQADAVGQVLEVLPILKVIEHDRRMLGRIGGSERDRAPAGRPGQIHPELEAGDGDEL